MKHMLCIMGFILPLTISGQAENVFVIADSTIDNQWLHLAKNWRYQKGDNKAWADPGFDDSNWEEFTSLNLNMPDGKQAIADRGEIAWFRKRIYPDSSLSVGVVITVYQEGASEIYLDGKLIRRLGVVNSNGEEAVYSNPYGDLLQLPLEKGKEQVLALRYVNGQYPFPIFSHTNGEIEILAATLDTANSSDPEKNRLAFWRQFDKNYHIALGIAVLMFIIFISFYLFFPNEKINGYFAISNFFLILFCVGVIKLSDHDGIGFWIIFGYDTCIVISSLISVYCIYLIFERPLDLVFKILSFLALLALGSFFLYDPDILSPIWALFLYFSVIRIAAKSWASNRVAAILFLFSSLIGLLYWMLILLNNLGVVQHSLRQYIPFAFMVSPIFLSIYLGYAFGKRSQLLMLNLERVQKLSIEKESILSLQKETLEQQVQERTNSLNQSIEDLKSTQAQLIQSEKMASLGELTAGIAHEIQNPLNFVNNFSEVSNELMDEMTVELDKGDIEEAKAIGNDIKQNLEKITHHGKRADAIVKGMLAHSRKSEGVKEPTDINALAEEILKLSYHGLRARDKSFNADFKTNFDPDLPKVNVVPQDIGRVLLNIINNAFQACNGHTDEPVVTVTTSRADIPSGVGGSASAIQITVSDNGPGIPDEIRDKIFQPFFTTKPTGQGTGLGLSLSYDIIKAHSGELSLSPLAEGAEFILTLPA